MGLESKSYETITRRDLLASVALTPLLFLPRILTAQYRPLEFNMQIEIPFSHSAKVQGYFDAPRLELYFNSWVLPSVNMYGEIHDQEFWINTDGWLVGKKRVEGLLTESETHFKIYKTNKNWSLKKLLYKGGGHISFENVNCEWDDVEDSKHYVALGKREHDLITVHVIREKEEPVADISWKLEQPF